MTKNQGPYSKKMQFFFSVANFARKSPYLKNRQKLAKKSGAQNCLYRLSSKTNSDIASTVLGSTVLCSTLF